MTIKFCIIYTFLVCWNPAILPIICAAALDRNWNNALMGERRTTYSALIADDDMDDWQPAVQPQNWLITTSATVPLSLTSSRLGERERISLMFERQQQAQHQHFLPNRYYAYTIPNNGSYAKRQTPSLTGPPSNQESSSSLVATAAETALNFKSKPYGMVTSKEITSSNPTYNNHNIKKDDNNNGRYRRFNSRRRDHPLMEDPYVKMSKEPMDIIQTERHLDASKHFRPSDVNRQSLSPHPYRSKVISPVVMENHLSLVPSGPQSQQLPAATATAKESFVKANLNMKDTSSSASSSSSSSSITAAGGYAPTSLLANKIDDENINEILLPIHAALDSVKEFCDFIKDIITDDNNKDDIEEEKANKDDKEDDSDTDMVDDDVDDDTDEEDKDGSKEASDTDTDIETLSPILSAMRAMMQTNSLPDSSFELPHNRNDDQNHNQKENPNQKNHSATTSLRSFPIKRPFQALTTSTPSSLLSQLTFQLPGTTTTGRARRLRRRKVRLPHLFGHRGRLKKRKAKRKIKRKFKKYIFPLLIAYKLLFLALIPLLVGGLTLLVGSTGMAGFFFALFAAVMTIRRGRAAGGDGGGDARASSVNYSYF